MARGRGRKRINEMYFGPVEEEAVFKYLSSNDERERNQIYNTFLKEPLNKMIESIIRRYKLYRKGVSFEELHTDTLSFLMTKAHRFEETQGTKAYSYYGTICKNYVLGLLIKDDKKLKQILSYEDIYLNIEEDQKYSYTLDETKNSDITKFIELISNEIKKELEKDEISNNKLMTDIERKLGWALVDILDNWEMIFQNMDGGKKYNKLSMLASVRENTNLTTKDIRLGMKRYKKLYYLLKNSELDDDVF